MENEEQLREEWKNRWDEPKILTVDGVADWWLAKLHQAELNWLTAQIERGEGMKHHWERCAEFADTKFQNAVNEDEAMEWEKAVTKDLGGVEAITDFLSPLIERKKEVEKLLGKEEGV